VRHDESATTLTDPKKKHTIGFAPWKEIENYSPPPRGSQVVTTQCKDIEAANEQGNWR